MAEVSESRVSLVSARHFRISASDSELDFMYSDTSCPNFFCKWCIMLENMFSCLTQVGFHVKWASRPQIFPNPSLYLWPNSSNKF